jgi:hypothetical protein
LPNWLHRKLGEKDVVQGLGRPFLRGRNCPKEKKSRNIGIFCRFEITENKKIKGKTETKKDK